MKNPKEAIETLNSLFRITTKGYERFSENTDDRKLYHTLCTRFGNAIQEADQLIDANVISEASRMLDYIFTGLRSEYHEIDALKTSLKEREMI